MAKTILPIAGAVVGAFFGAPQIGFAIGSLIAGAIPGEAQGPRIGETGAQTSQEGSPRAIIYGTAMCSGNVIASGPLIKRDVEENQGGKGGTDVSTEHAYRTYAVRVCEGPIGDLLRIWEDDKLVFDIRPESTMLAESAKWKSNKVVYVGDETQLPDPTLQMIFGVDEVPAHRGSAYVVFIEEDLTDRRGSIPQYRFEVAAVTTAREMLAPLQIFDWYDDGKNPPRHSIGQGRYHHIYGGDFDFDTYVAALHDILSNGVFESGDPYIEGTGEYCENYIGYIDSNNSKFSRFPNGANLSTNPRYVWSRNSPRPAGAITFSDVAGGLLSEQLVAAGAVGPSEKVYYTRSSESWGGGFPYSASLWKVFANGGAPSSGEFSFFWQYFFPTDDFINGNAVVSVRIERLPSPPPDYVLVTGTAKILCDNVYIGESLIQRALGPVLLPDDPNYSNDVFWSDARNLAITAGIMRPDVAYSVVVNEYAKGYVTVAGEPVALSVIVEDLHRRCDFPQDKFDASGLNDLVTGLVLAGDYSGADAINTLRSLYLFDRADFDKKIHYPKRGAAVVATLTYDDLVEEPDTSRREQAIEYPKKLHLGYQNAVGGYAVAKATSGRSSPDVRVVGETTMQVPVVLNPDQAAQAAAILHKVAYAEAEGEVKLSVPDSFLRFVPSNCIGLALRGRVSRLRIEQMDVAAGIIELTLRHDRQSAYTSNVTGVPIPAPTPPPPTIVGESVLAVIDISARTDSEDDLHYLVAATGGMPAWAGATVQRSLDGGASYANAASVGRGIIMGSLVNDLNSASELFTDTTNTIRVRLFRDTLRIEDITETEFLSEGGAFVIMRPDGSSEVLQYRDAVEVSTGVFDLSHLHRGQLNSGASAHLAGSVLVGLARAVHVDAQSAWIGADLTHRAVSNGESPELAAEQTETFTAKSQTEWPVAYLAASFDGTTLAATWTPRHRFGTEDAPVASVNFRGYRVKATNLLQTIELDTTSPSFSADASAIAMPFSLSVAALNRITGPGEPTVAIVGGEPFPTSYRPSGLEVSTTADVAHQINDMIIIMGRAGASSAISFHDAATLVQLGIHGVASSQPVTAVSEGDLTFCVFALSSGNSQILRFDRSVGFLPTHTINLFDPITDLCIGGGFLWAADPYNEGIRKYDLADPTVVTFVPLLAQCLVSDDETVFSSGLNGIQRLNIVSGGIDMFPLTGSAAATRLLLAGDKLIVHEGEVNSYNPITGARLTRLADGVDEVSAGGGVVVVFEGIAQPGGVFEDITLTPTASVEDPDRDTTHVFALGAGRLLVAVNPTMADPLPWAQLWIS